MDDGRRGMAGAVSMAQGARGFARTDVEAFDIEKERLALARSVLAGLAGLFLIASCAHIASGESIDAAAAKEVFDFVKGAFPPLVALVLGAYFTRRCDA